jgi:hypothetical protein
MKKSFEVYVLLDSSTPDGTVFAVVTSEDLASEWPDFDPAYSVVGPLEVDDPDSLALFAEAREAVNGDETGSDAE